MLIVSDKRNMDVMELLDKFVIGFWKKAINIWIFEGNFRNGLIPFEGYIMSISIFLRFLWRFSICQQG